MNSTDFNELSRHLVEATDIIRKTELEPGEFYQLELYVNKLLEALYGS